MQRYLVAVVVAVLISGCLHGGAPADTEPDPDPASVPEISWNQSYTGIGESLEPTNVSRELRVTQGSPAAITRGPNGSFWVLTNGFNEGENGVRRFSPGWVPQDEQHTLYPDEKIVYDLAYGNGQWWVLAGVQGEKVVYAYDEGWNPTGSSHAFDDANAGGIVYTDRWYVLGGPNASTISVFDDQWRLQDEIDIGNTDVRSQQAIAKRPEGWIAITQRPSLDQDLARFDTDWRRTDHDSVMEGPAVDLMRSDAGWWVMVSMTDTVRLYR